MNCLKKKKKIRRVIQFIKGHVNTSKLLLFFLQLYFEYFLCLLVDLYTVFYSTIVSKYRVAYRILYRLQYLQYHFEKCSIFVKIFLHWPHRNYVFHYPIVFECHLFCCNLYEKKIFLKIKIQSENVKTAQKNTKIGMNLVYTGWSISCSIHTRITEYQWFTQKMSFHKDRLNLYFYSREQLIEHLSIIKSSRCLNINKNSFRFDLYIYFQIN